MEQHTAEDWEYGLWSSLNLEFLCRAALAHISPTLLADPKDWRSRHYALGLAPIAKNFVPKSVNTSELLEMLAQLVPGFSATKDFCVEHVGRRNAELHSGDLEFKDLQNAKWLPKYYTVCKTLLSFMNKELADVFQEAGTAEELITASADEAAKAVQRDITIHKDLWDKVVAADKAIASSQSQVWASRAKGHRAQCPACANTGLLRGALQGTVITKINEDEIVQKQTVIPSSFECKACGLKISGLAKLVACGLGNAYTETSTSSAARFFSLYTEGDMAEARAIEPEYEDDYN